jgi:hypothetical protein
MSSTGSQRSSPTQAGIASPEAKHSSRPLALRFVRADGFGSAHPGSRYWGSGLPRPYHFPGADSTFSSHCGAISRRARLAVRPSRAAMPATGTPRFNGPTIGSSRPPFARRAATDRLQAALGWTASTEPDTRPCPLKRNKHRTTSQPCQGNCRSFWSREHRRGFRRDPLWAKGSRRALHNRRGPHQLKS